jgi:hypothetical protein
MVIASGAAVTWSPTHTDSSPRSLAHPVALDDSRQPKQHARLLVFQSPGRRVQKLGRVGDLRIRMEMWAQDCDASPEPSVAKGTRVLSRLAYLTLAGTSPSLSP